MKTRSTFDKVSRFNENFLESSEEFNSQLTDETENIKKHELGELLIDANDKPTTTDHIELLDSKNTILNSIEAVHYRIHDPGIHKQTFSGKVLDWDETHFTVEIAIDSDLKKYQTREFQIELLKDSDLLKHGQLIQILYFLKKEQMTMQIRNGESFIPKDTFPDENILEGLESDLFKFDND